MLSLQILHRRLPVTVEYDVRDDAGAEAYALYRPSKLDFVLDAGTPADQRRLWLMHEYGHACDDLLGRVDPADDEGQKNRISMMAEQFAHDLDSQGGERAIHALFGDLDIVIPGEVIPGDTVVVFDDELSEYPTDVGCPRCGVSHPSRDVRNGRVFFSAKHDMHTIWRTLACLDCDSESRWQQVCTAEGLALPKVTIPPTIRNFARAS